MGNREILFDYIRQHPGLDDDELSHRLRIEPRQTVNKICRELARSGLISRRNGPSGKLCNYPEGDAASAALATESGSLQERRASASENERVMAGILAAAKGWNLQERSLPIAQRQRSFDFVSGDGQIVGDGKSGTGLTAGGNRASAKISDAVATAHALDQVEKAATRFLCFSDEHLFRFVLSDLKRYSRRHPLLLILLDLRSGRIVKEAVLDRA
jgi:hypothetical protein